MKNLHFLSGLPILDFTVLEVILNKNPNAHNNIISGVFLMDQRNILLKM